MAEYKYKFRVSARIVAFIELVYLFLQTLLVSVVLLGMLVVTFCEPAHVKSKYNEWFPGEDVPMPNIPWLVWLIITICSVVLLFEFVANAKLHKATKEGAEPEEALSQAKFWRNVAIILLIPYWFVYSVLAVVNLLFIFFVWKYIYELESRVHEKRNSQQNKLDTEKKQAYLHDKGIDRKTVNC